VPCPSEGAVVLLAARPALYSLLHACFESNRPVLREPRVREACEQPLYFCLHPSFQSKVRQHNGRTPSIVMYVRFLALLTWPSTLPSTVQLRNSALRNSGPCVHSSASDQILLPELVKRRTGGNRRSAGRHRIVARGDGLSMRVDLLQT